MTIDGIMEASIKRSRAEADARLEKQAKPEKWHHYSNEPQFASGLVDGWPYLLMPEAKDGNVEKAAIACLQKVMAESPLVHGFWSFRSPSVDLVGLCANGVVDVRLRTPHGEAGAEQEAIRALFGT